MKEVKKKIHKKRVKKIIIIMDIEKRKSTHTHKKDKIHVHTRICIDGAYTGSTQVLEPVHEAFT